MKELGQKVENKRLGIKGVVTGLCRNPTFFVTDENGKEWSGGQGSPFDE